MHTGASTPGADRAGRADGVDFFVSYTEADRRWAEWIAWQLEDAGYRVLLQAWDFVAGSHFVHEMHQAALRAARTVAVVSESYLASAYREAEWQAAWAADPSGDDRRLVPLRVEDCPRPGLLAQLVGVDLFGMDQPAARERLLGAIATGRRKPRQSPGFPGDRVAGPRPSFPGPSFPGRAPGWNEVWQPGRSPFPGLAAFDASRALVFKARDEETSLVTGRLRAPGGSGVLALVGPSGCGKSSLMAAGVAPRLANDPDWLVLRSMTPGGRPLFALAGVLAAAGQQHGLGWEPARLSARLSTGAAALGVVEELLAAAGAAAGHVLLIIDQAEELLVRPDQASRETFLSVLRALTAGPVRAVATLRSEYLDRLIEAGGSAGLTVHAEALNPLPRDLLHLVIREPVRLAGLSIEDELIARMVDDTGDGQALPLLAYTLQRLYRESGEAGTTVLSAALYARIGGVRGALVDHADTALAEAVAATGHDDGQVLAALLKLVTVDDEGRPVRRRRELDQLPDATRGMLTPFVTHRLLTVGGGQAGGPVTVELTHERILTAWQPLADAVRARAAVLAEIRRVELAAAEWDSHGRDDGYLWPSARLDACLAVLGPASEEPPSPGGDPPVASGEPVAGVRADAGGLRFLAASGQHARLRERRERRQRRTVRGTVAALVVIVVAVPTTLFVLQRAETREVRQHAAVLDLLNQVSATRGVDMTRALRLALAADAAALDESDRVSAESTLLNLLTTPHQVGDPLTGHTATVWAVAFSPDGRTLASASGDNTLRLWDVADPADPAPLGQVLTDHTDAVNAVAFSPDGRTLASGSDDETVRLWNVADPAHPTALGGPLTGHTGEVESVAFAPDGRTLASGSYDQTVRLWNVADPAHPTALGGPLTGHTGVVWSVAFAPDGRTLASGSYDQTVRLWNVADPAHLTTLGGPLTGHTGPIGAVAFSPDGRTLASSGTVRDQTVRLWNISDPAHPTSLASPLSHPDTVRTVAFSPDGRTLASGSYDKTVRLWDVADPAHPALLGDPLTGHTDTVTAVAFSPDGHMLASASSDDTLRLWDAVDPAYPTPIGDPLSLADTVRSGAFSPDGRTIASTTSSDVVQLWDVADPDRSAPLPSLVTGHFGTVWSAAFSPDGHTLATASDDGTAQLWALTDPAHPIPLGDPLIGHTGPIGEVVFSPDGRTLATTSYGDDTVRLWDVSDPAHPAALGRPLTGDTDVVWPVAFSPDGHTLATAADRNVKLWDVTDPARSAALGNSLTGHTNTVWSVAFSLDGRTLATASADTTVRLWDVSDPTSPAPIGDPMKHPDTVRAAAFSPDGRTLATASDDRTVRLWDVADPVHPVLVGRPLTGHTDRAMWVAFSPDGHTLASAGDQTVRLWDLSPLTALRDDVVARACAQVGGLDKDAWEDLHLRVPYRQNCRA